MKDRGRGVTRTSSGRAAAAACLILLATVAVAQTPDAERQAAAMQRTVLDQLDAFRRSDWTIAYSFASTAIREQFTPEAFREMVSRGYPAIARSASATVLRTEIVDRGRGYVEIRVEGQNGQRIDALYELIDEQGAWKVNGVVAKPAERGDLTRA